MMSNIPYIAASVPSVIRVVAGVVVSLVIIVVVVIIPPLTGGMVV